MRKFFVIAAMLTASLGALRAQAVVSDDFSRLQVTYKNATPDVQSVDFNGDYVLLTLPGYTSGGEVGAPALPVRSDVIEVPFCDNIVVTVENAVYDTIQLSQYSLFYPMQPSRSKSDTTAHDLIIDQSRYSTNSFYGLPLAEVEVMGVARDRRLAQLRFSPVQVNPVTGQVIVCRSADVTVTYVGADINLTLEHYQRYHTPAFSVGTTLNNLYSSAKSISAPVRMVIAVPNALRCSAIDRFANWKRKQGLIVDVLNYGDQGLSTNSSLAEYLTSLYTNATAEAPAPTFLLLVGDHAQLRAFNSQLSSGWSSSVDNDHITDLYFATWTSGDNLPDCYQGRFSATDTNTLTAIINKTLLYEQYNFSDDSYLARAALVSGEDNGYHSVSGYYADYAWIYADPTMDYIAYNYVNAANGYTQVSYYKNDTSYAPTGVSITGYCSATSSATALRNLYNTGIGWINYSAHGDWDKWHKPSFTVSNVNSMSNNNKPSFMIGNCCLSCKFDKATCFGEALLRKGNNAGAVAYIGGTNSTYWKQDFYWSVGVRSNISHSMSPTYNSNKLGVYDRLFHTHSEAFEGHANTAGAVVYYGNLSVNASSSDSDMKQYYWEIYELMGDPSLMPWLGKAADLSVTLVRGTNNLRVVTSPNAYVAIVDEADFNLRGAAFADASGVVTFDIPASTDLSGARLSVTLQNHKPFSQPCSMVSIDESNALTNLQVYPNPATDRVTIDGLPEGSTVEVYDAQGRKVEYVKCGNSGTLTQLHINTLPAGLYLLRIQTPSTVIVRKIIVNK